MGSRGPLPVAWSSETARRRNTFFATVTAPQEDDVFPPESISDAAREIWLNTAPALLRSGRLRAAMAAVFAVFCELAADVERLTREVAEEGEVLASGRSPNPKCRLLRDTRRDLLSYAKAFGLDAASDARLPAGAASQASEDPLDEFIRSRPA